MTQYQSNVGSQSVVGNLTWNANSTLEQLAITDPFNSADQQTCNYTYDDLGRIASVNCGSAFSQTFSMWALGNITKTGTLSFAPSYNTSTNQITSVGAQNYTYDADGNLLSTGTGTGTNTYTWNGFGGMTGDTPSGGSTVGVSYDALGRAAMTNINGASFTEFVYAPDGSKLALMNGQTLFRARVPLPGGGLAVYSSGPTLLHYWHPDWQGTMRVGTNPSTPTYYYSGGYAPYGETYAEGANSFTPDFASLMGDTSSELDDAMFREYNPTEGRWMSPDPAGLAAVDLTNPQSLNRYAYVMNNPTTLIDPSGLHPCVGPPPCVSANLDNEPQSSNWYPGNDFPGSNSIIVGWYNQWTLWFAPTWPTVTQQGQLTSVAIYGFSPGDAGGWVPSTAGGANSGPFIGAAPAPPAADNRPSCWSVFYNALEGGDPTDQAASEAGNAVSEAAQHSAEVYIATRALTVPLRSGVVRAFAGIEGAASLGAVAIPAALGTYEVAKAEYVSAKANITGQCQNNFWSLLPRVSFPW